MRASATARDEARAAQDPHGVSTNPKPSGPVTAKVLAIAYGAILALLLPLVWGWAALPSGAVNATAPQPVRNRDFARSLGRVLRRPALLRVPARPLRLALGEMADELLLGGQCILPKRAQELGYRFRHPELEAALRDLLR